MSLFVFFQENAHFSISEALIAAIEQMKWNQVLRPQEESDHEVESDEEIQELKQRIRIRRRERLKEVRYIFCPTTVLHVCAVQVL